MKIDLIEIYKGLDEWRVERGITVESQKKGYLVNVMEEFGELAQALRDYEKFSKQDGVEKQNAEHQIIDAICDICVFTINAGADIRANEKIVEIDTEVEASFEPDDFYVLIKLCAGYAGYLNSSLCFNEIFVICVRICEYYGFNFETAMLETINEISSRTGSYDEKAKKWVKDTSDDAKSKWYKADYEKARAKK